VYVEIVIVVLILFVRFFNLWWRRNLAR